MKILSFGEVLWDVYFDKKYLGGAPLNFAAHIARHGFDAYILSSVGEDVLGNQTLERIENLGVVTDYVSLIKGKETGKCLVSLDENYVPGYNLLCDVAYDYISSENVSGDFDVLYFGTLALRGEYNCNSVKRLLESKRFKEVFADVNIRPPFYNKETVELAVKNATILKISLEELSLVLGLLDIDTTLDYSDAARSLCRKYANLSLIIITLGADGAYAFWGDGMCEYYCPCVPAEVVSTVGAGDSFSAAFLYQYLNGAGLEYSMDYASRIAGFVVSKYEALPDYNPRDFV